MFWATLFGIDAVSLYLLVDLLDEGLVEFALDHGVDVRVEEELLQAVKPTYRLNVEGIAAYIEQLLEDLVFPRDHRVVPHYEVDSVDQDQPDEDRVAEEPVRKDHRLELLLQNLCQP